MNEHAQETASDTASGKTRTLHQRIAAIAGEAQVKVSGRTAPTAGARPALSIADVDRVLGDLMAEHGVTSDFEFLSEPTDRIEVTANDKKLQTFRVHLRVYVTNAEDPTEFLAREVWDDGSNVSGAVSFALKRYLRALFHLAEDDDTQQTQQRQAAQRQDFTPPREARQEVDRVSREQAMDRPRGPVPDPSEPQLSAAQLAERGPLYDSAVELGKSREEAERWVNTLLDTPQPDGKRVSVGSIRKKLDSELAKRGSQQAAPAAQAPAEAAKDPDPPKDPDALVCPFCGSADAPGERANEPERMTCWGGKGGCAKTFDKVQLVKRHFWEEEQAAIRDEQAAYQESQKQVAAEASGANALERLVDEAGVRPAGVS